MEETGTARCPGNLDPRAQEFRPRNQQFTLLPPHIYHPYPSPFMYCGGGYQPTQFSPAYVRHPGIPIQQPPPPPPPLVPPTPVSPPAPPVPPSASPTRALLLSSVPEEATEDTIKRELEAFGEVRAVQMGQDGMVTVHYYDLRHAEAAVAEIQEQHMQQQVQLRRHYNVMLMSRPNCAPLLPMPLTVASRGRVMGRTVWAQFVFPVPGVGLLDAHNQGTIVIFNLDSAISTSQLKEIFQPFGAVKEVRETPMKKHQRFVEFYDIRDADKAIKEMNGKEISGKKVLIEFSRPGGQRRFPNARYPYSYSSAPASPSASKSFSRSISDASSNSSPQTRRVPNKPNWNARKNSFRSGSEERSEESSKSTGSVSGSSTRKNTNRCAKNKGNNGTVSGSKDHVGVEKQEGRNKSNKGRHKPFDSQFWIREEAIFGSSCKRDTRTTVMIKNIPNKYSQKLLLNMLDNHCINCNEQIADGDNQPLSSYDFVYLPIDFNNKCNVGYGFVNFTSPEATWRLYKAFHKQHWEVFNSRKICEITYARLQGLEALKDHFKNSKFACDTDDYLPVMFEPPRNGKQLTDPEAVGGHTKLSPTKPVMVNEQGEESSEYDEELMWLQLHGHNGGERNDEQDTSDDSQNQQATTTSSSSSSCCNSYTITSAEANGV